MTKKKGTQTPSTALYVPTDFFMLRTPALPAQTMQRISTIGTQECASLSSPSDLDLTLQAQRVATQRLLLAMSSDPQIDQAIAIASTSLHKSLSQLQHGDISPNRAKKVFSRLLRYLIRMSTRPTPFGLFAGVALGSFDEKTSAHLGTPAIARFRTRPDMNWLLAVLKELETSPALLRQLCVYSNQMASIVGGRVHLPYMDTYGQQQNQAVSLRATPIVHKTLQLAQEPVPYLALRDALLQTFPGASIEQVEHLLCQLWEHGLLLSTLHPPLTSTQPARYLHQQLEKLQDVEQIRELLADVLESASALDAAGIGSPSDPLDRLVQVQNILAADEKPHPPIQVDSLLSLHTPTLHTRIGVIAAQAAELLLRLTPLPEGSPSLKEYSHRFLEKYGENAEVPLLELLSPEAGLGAPAGYTQPSAPPSSQHLLYETRHRLLQALVQDALNSRSLEVELTQAHLTALQIWHANLEQLPRSLEIYLQVGATSREALDQGKFFAVVSPNPGSPQGGRTFGRFFDLLGEPGRNALQSLLTLEESLEPEMLFAELSYQHARARSSNVAIRPGLRTYEIVVGTTPSVPAERVIPLSDLVVGVHQDHFYLRSLRHHKKVMICQLHMLNIQHAPNVCRFLIEASGDGLPALSRFDWGHLSSAPFLPRITVSEGQPAKLILAPACWNLEATTIHPQGEGSIQARWFAGLDHWRIQWRVPRYVYLTQTDHRLLLDLEHPLMAAELFEALHSLKEGQQVMLQEVLPDFEHLWLIDTQGASYFAEIVIPLLRRDVLTLKRQTIHQDDEISLSSTSQIDGDSPCSHVVPRSVRVFSPGSSWNYVKLYCGTTQQEEIIAGPLRDFVHHLREQDLIDRWFFLRYADPEPHLRVRIHTPKSEQIQPALALLLSWGGRLTTQGRIQRFSLDTYEREVARYGGAAAIDLLEQVFSLDSDICSSLIAAQYTHHLTLDPLAIAVCSLDRFFSAWNYDPQHRLHWLQKRTEKYAWSSEFRHERKRYCALLAPGTEPIDPELRTQRTLLSTLLTPLERQLPPLVAQVHTLVHEDQFWVAEDNLLASLAHMHKVRMLGLGESREQQLYAFWRHTLESICHRLTSKKGIRKEQEGRIN